MRIDALAESVRKLLILGAGLSLMTGVVLAKRNDPRIELAYVPQQIVGAASPGIDQDVFEIPLSVRLEDGRAQTDPSVIGTRTDDDDRPYELRATNDVIDFTDSVFRRNFALWGVTVDPDAGLTLVGMLRTFRVLETNQAVGATYKAEVRLAARLVDASDRIRWTGSASGDATRYGRKFSAANANEVLSDALKEAVANLIGRRDLQDAWLGRTGSPSDTASPRTRPSVVGDVLSPPALLDEVLGLMETGMENATLVEFVQQKTLTRRMSADDLASWKKSGVAETVLRAALNCPVE